MKKLKKCMNCKSKNYHAKGLCKKCYQIKWKSENPNYNKEYKKLNYDKYAEEKRQYQRKYNKTEQGLNSMRNTRHKRRAVYKKTNITTEWLVTLKNLTIFCELCNCRMHKDGRKLNGKSLDHIKPINVGGKHMRNNVRFICKQCNSKRPKDGLDIGQRY